MAEPRFRVRHGDPDYGPTCPLCASPKSLQARKCAACETDRKRAGEGYTPPPITRLCGAANPAYRHGRYMAGARRGSGGSSVPAPDHPWRLAEHAGAVAHRAKQAA
jgi:hypothetical protein